MAHLLKFRRPKEGRVAISSRLNEAIKVLSNITSPFQRQEGREGVIISSLNAAITAVNFAENGFGGGIPQTWLVLSAVSVLLTKIRDEMVDGTEVGTIISSLNAAIIAVNIARNVLGGISPTQPVFCAINFLLTNLRDEMVGEVEYVHEPGLGCVDNCRAIDRVVKGNTLEYLSQPVRDAMKQFTATMGEVQKAIGQVKLPKTKL